VLPGKQSSIKPIKSSATPRSFNNPFDMKRVWQAVAVLAVGVALAVWGIASNFQPGPITRLEVAPPYVDVGPTPPPKTISSRWRAFDQTPAPVADATPQRIVVPAYTPPPAVEPPAPAPARPANSVVPLTPITRTQRENRLPVPELRFETFEEVSDAAIYGPNDRGVQPPVVIVPQQLGRVPLGARREDLTYVDVIINEEGRVMQVKANESPQTLDESMVITMSLSAAKSWRFKPASKDGRPVKFRQTIPVSLR
jgi:hypothetical protein